LHTATFLKFFCTPWLFEVVDFKIFNRYLHGIPEDSRVAKPHGFLKEAQLTPERLAQIKALNEIAQLRGQSLSQMAIAWLLKDDRVTSVLIGVSSVEQLDDNIASLAGSSLSGDEIYDIEVILGNGVKP